MQSDAKYAFFLFIYGQSLMVFKGCIINFIITIIISCVICVALTKKLISFGCKQYSMLLLNAFMCTRVWMCSCMLYILQTCITIRHKMQRCNDNADTETFLFVRCANNCRLVLIFGRYHSRQGRIICIEILSKIHYFNKMLVP